jgi:hypothetical protein
VAVEALSQICADVTQTKRRSEHLAPLQGANPLRGCNSDLAQNSNTPLDPKPTFRARGRAQLVRRSHRSMMHAAQGQPRKRGAFHDRASGEGGSTRTIFDTPCEGASWFGPVPGLKAQAESYSLFGTSLTQNQKAGQKLRRIPVHIFEATSLQ